MFPRCSRESASQLPREQYEKRLPRMWADGERALAAMDRHLDRREWFVGDGMMLADIALYAYTHVAPEGEFDLARFANIRAWLERVAAEPGHVAIGA